jgi:hypothetical protein
MARKDWSVWSLAPDRTVWMEVASEMTMAEATDDARRRNSFAAAITTPDLTTAYFLATPSAQAPGPEQVPPLPAQERVEAQTGPQRLARDLADAADKDGYDGPIPGAPLTSDVAWLTDYRQVVEFGRVLDAADEFDSNADRVFDYFEGPHKWAPEHGWWVALDRPRPDSGLPWQAFVKKLDAR